MTLPFFIASLYLPGIMYSVTVQLTIKCFSTFAEHNLEWFKNLGRLPGIGGLFWFKLSR